MAYRLKWRPPGPVAAKFVAHRPGPVKTDGAPWREGDDPDDVVVPVDYIRGPVGSGKTVACAIRVFLHMMEQKPGHDGWRRTRWIVVRNTYLELETTTIKSWLEWFPEEHFGPFRWSKPYLHKFRFLGAKVDAEVYFVAIENMNELRKVLGMELTGGWLNELKEQDRQVVLEVRGRCGRYPSRRDGQPGATWFGVIADTNAPGEDHYLAMWEGHTAPPEWMDEVERALMLRPAGVTPFVQPGGLMAVREKAEGKRRGRIVKFRPNPQAENLKHLPPGYYMGRVPGSTQANILAYACNEFASTLEARAVYPDWNEDAHLAPEALEYVPGVPLLGGADFARNPALIVGQVVEGQLRVLREFVGSNVATAAFFANDVVPAMNVLFPGWQKGWRGWGDPSGSGRTGGDDSTMFSHARAAGMTLIPAITNDPDRRQGEVENLLMQTVRGKPKILVSPVCRMLVQGFRGGYQLAPQKLDANERSASDEPVKNAYSHPHDALQYLALGVMGGTSMSALDRMKAAARMLMPNGRRGYDPLAKRRA